jgi:hypothetical protein
MAGQTAHLLTLANVSTNQNGSYYVTVSNSFGAIRSEEATLFVDTLTYPTILWEPYGDTVPVGGYYSFSVAALGTAPLEYEWYLDGTRIAGATSRVLTLTNIQPSAAGVYAVKIQNPVGTVWSVDAKLLVTTNYQGGGAIAFANKFPASPSVDAPIYDLDGVTRVSGSNFLAQLYAGPSLELLRPAGQPTPFRSGNSAGYFYFQIVVLGNVAPNVPAVTQVRAWDGSRGSSYEEARALGGRFGKSAILTVTTGGPFLPPQNLIGLQSFSLQAGLPRFTSGTIRFSERLPQNVIVWTLAGEPGYRYLVEKSFRDWVWQPYVVVTNISGTVNFTDSASSGSGTIFYRSRILD